MDQSLIVIATSHPVPTEDGAGRVESDLSQRVPNSLYYRRRIQAGELRQVDDQVLAPEVADPAPAPTIVEPQPSASKSRSRLASNASAAADVATADQSSNPSEDAA